MKKLLNGSCFCKAGVVHHRHIDKSLHVRDNQERGRGEVLLLL